MNRVPVCARAPRFMHVCTNTFSAHAGLRFVLSTDVIVFLMVLEVITPCNVTRRLVFSGKPQHGGSEVPSTDSILPHK